jgi:hypothetical protein
MSDFKLQFPKRQIPHWAEQYAYQIGDADITNLGRKARERGYLRKDDYLTLCYWKTPRTQSRCARNPDDRVREATRLALGTTDNRAKIGILRLLDGVDWPTASVILHFCDPLPYPILDYRALWSLGYRKPPPYTFEFWMAYTAFTRELSRATGHSMRTVDRALWQYSKEKQ